MTVYTLCYVSHIYHVTVTLTDHAYHITVPLTQHALSHNCNIDSVCFTT